MSRVKTLSAEIATDEIQENNNNREYSNINARVPVTDEFSATQMGQAAKRWQKISAPCRNRFHVALLTVTRLNC